MLSNLPPSFIDRLVNASPHHEAAGRLCMDCGLCCSGVLFDIVMLQPGDQAKALKARGLKVKRGEFFAQPCPALCGTQCTIYEHRPTRCRLFECQQYRQVADGSLPAEEAAARIEEVKCEVEAIKAMMERMGCQHPRGSLGKRYNALLAARGKTDDDILRLTEAYDKLEKVFTDHFRVEPV